MGKIKSFLTGGMVGAVIGMLFAPQKGDESRKKLQEESDKWSPKIKEMAAGAKDTAQKTIDKAKEIFGKK
ncbi:MAG: YtxH domain-containing protein [Candidatus Saganbacteria bacterium]|nr:YtxH domain-containing protein [Candidatus Saganbacteria bacterium]